MTEALAAELTRAILGGKIEPGAFLREVELAERYRVSRQSIRAALIELHHEGILRHEAHRGFWVPMLTEGDLDEIFQIRALIERDAARRLAATPEHVAGPAAALEQLRALPADVDRDRFFELHFQFHHTLVAAVEPSRLVRFYDTLSAETWLLLLKMPNVPEESPASQQYRTHEDIIEAIRRGDPDLAAEASARHMAYGREQALLGVRLSRTTGAVIPEAYATSKR